MLNSEFGSGSGQGTEEDAQFIFSLAGKMVIFNASSFYRRIVEPTQRFPLRLLNLASEESSRVMEVSNSLLQGQQDLEMNALKVRNTFYEELIAASSSGKLPSKLKLFADGLKTFWYADVRDCERTNKTISLLLERCPNVGNDLLSSRVGLGFYMGETCAGEALQGKKWSLFQPVAAALRNLCLAGWDAKDEIMGNPFRWSPPMAPENLPPPEETKRMHEKLQGKAMLTVAEKWAVCVNMSMNQKLGSCTAMESVAVLLCFGHRQVGGQSSQFFPYLVAEKVRTSLRLLRCKMDMGNHAFEIELPMQFVSSHAVIGGFYKAVLKGDTVTVFALGVTVFGDLSTGSIREGKIEVGDSLSHVARHALLTSAIRSIQNGTTNAIVLFTAMTNEFRSIPIAH